MSSDQILATVTVTLCKLLDQAAKSAVPGASARPGRPREEPFSRTSPAILVYLYQVTSNTSARRNDPRPMPGPRPELGLQAYDLQYLLAFYGNETELEPQRMLNAALRILNDHALLSQQELTAAGVEASHEEASYRFLAGVCADESCDAVRLSLPPMGQEEMTTLWGRFLS
jgi:hypothetical protein